MNSEVPIQLTLLASAVTVTVMLVPGAALDINAGDMLTLPLTPELVSMVRTWD